VAQAARWLATLKASGCLCLLDGEENEKKRLNDGDCELGIAYVECGTRRNQSKKEGAAASVFGSIAIKNDIVITSNKLLPKLRFD